MLLLIPLTVLLMSASVMSNLICPNVGNNRKVCKMKVLLDAWIDNPAPAAATNHNDDDFLSIGHLTTSTAKRALLKFEDIAPADCAVDKILEAKLYMYFEGVYRAGQTVATAPFIPYSLLVHRVKNDWIDHEVTGIRRKSTPITNWITPMLGSLLNDQDAEMNSQSTFKTIYQSQPEGYVEFEVTDFIRSLVEGASNNGLIVWAINEIKEGVDLHFTSDHSATTAQHAYIKVLCKI